jgi:Yip1 domain
MRVEDLPVSTGVIKTGRNSLGNRISDSWHDMRKATRRLINERPAEPRLLFYVLMSDIVFFLSWSLKAIVKPSHVFVDKANPGTIGMVLIAALLFRTSAMYFFSFVLYAGAKMFGGKGDWQETRCGVFWGALVAAPFGLLMAVVTVMFTYLEPYFPIFGADWIALPPYWLSLIPFIWFISQGLAEAHRFKTNSVSFQVMSLIAVFGLFVAVKYT